MKYAMCQELFVDWDWERQCRFLQQTGYTGIEVAPFTLAGQLSSLPLSERQKLRKTATDHGLTIIGLHWLLAKTAGFHLTSPDADVRRRTADYLAELGGLCADLGGTLMVLGSPQQRNLPADVSPQQGTDFAIQTLQLALPRIAERGVDLLIEPLTTRETNFITTCQQGADLIAAVNHPNLALHQDVKAMLGESVPVPDLIRQFAPLTRHFHANDGNLLGPGMGETDFTPLFSALQETGYSGWVSVEVFDYAPGAENITTQSLNYMQRIERELNA